jgi:hypothetical protein
LTKFNKGTLTVTKGVLIFLNNHSQIAVIQKKKEAFNNDSLSKTVVKDHLRIFFLTSFNFNKEQIVHNMK